MKNNESLTFIDRGLRKVSIEDYQGAIEDFNSAIKLDPKNIHAYLERAKAKIASGKVELILNALTDYNLVLEIEPDNAEALAGRGTLIIEIGQDNLEDIRDGINNLERALKINPNLSSYWNLGIAKERIGDSRGMLEAFLKYLEYENPQDHQLGETNFFLGIASLNLKDYNSAIIYFTRAIQNKAAINYLWSFFNRAICHLQINNREEALNDFAKVIQLKPDMIEVYIRRADIYSSIGKKEYAEIELKKGLEYDDKCIDLLEKLAMLYFFDKKYSSALKVYEKLVSLDSNSAHHFQNVGACYIGLKRYEEGIKALNQSIKLNNSRAYAYYYRGICYFNLGDDRACEDWELAYKHGCEDARKMIQQHCKYGIQFSLDNLVITPKDDI